MASATLPSSADTLPASHTVEVGTGLYRGIVQDLAEGRHVIGSGEEADLVLLEPGLAAQHAAIALRGANARVEALAEGVVIAGSGPLPAGSALTVRLPATITVAGIETLWRERQAERASPPSGARGRLRLLFGRTAVPGLATAALLAVAVVTTVPGPIADAAVPPPGSAKDGIQPVSAVPSAVSAPLPLPTPLPGFAAAVPRPAPEVALGAALSDLRRQVAEAGLHSVRIEVAGGAVAATGSVEPALATRWETLQRAFDERFLGEITLINSVAVRAEKLPASLGIEGVWQGAQPYIVLRGQRYFVGAMVEGGWAIRAIEPDRVMLERDGRLVAMRF